MKRVQCKKIIFMAIISIAVGVFLSAAMSHAAIVNWSTADSCSLYEDPQDVYVSQDHAYIAAGDSGLYVVNIINMQRISSFSTQGFAEAIYVRGEFAYVACGEAGLEIFDLANPQNLPGHCETPGYAYDVQVYGNYAYVADGSSGLQIIDVSDKGDPKHVRGFYYTENEAATIHMKNSDARAVFVSWPYVYLAVQSTDQGAVFKGGLRVFRVTNPLDPDLSVIGSDKEIPEAYSTLGSATSVYVTGAMAYVTYFDSSEGESHLRQIDVSDPSDPLRPSAAPYEFLLDGYAMDVHVFDAMAYVASYYNGLHIVDTRISGSNDTIETDGWALDVFVEGNILFACEGFAGSFTGLKAYREPSFGDFNGDALVDIEDYEILAESWQKIRGDYDFNPTADIDNDGDVDIDDYKALIEVLRESNPNEPGDFNGDEIVDSKDADVFSASFEKTVGMLYFNPYADLDKEPDGWVAKSDSDIFIEYWRPKPPESFSLEAYSSSEVLFSWSAVSNADYYTPKIMDEKGQFMPIIDEDGREIRVEKGGTSYLLGSLSPSTDIFCVVSVWNGAGESVNSGTAGARTEALTNMPPVISDELPAHSAMVQGQEEFEPIDLKEYVIDDNTDAVDILWEVDTGSFTSVLDVDIDDDNIVVVSVNNTGFTGSETIELTAIDEDALESETRLITFTIGTTDADSSEVQILIDSALINAVVDVPAGIYTFSSNLLIEKNIHLRGAGAGNTIFELGDYCIDIMMPEGYDGFYTYRVPRFNSLTNVALQGITIRGGRKCPSEAQRWIQVGYGETGYGGYWETIEYPYGKAPVHNYSRKLSIVDCKIIDNRGKKASAIYTGRYTQLDISNTLIYDNEHPPSTISLSARRGAQTVPLMQRLDGAIFADQYARLRVVYSTIVGNGDELGYSNSLFGAIAKDMYATVSIVNSILADNGSGGQVLSCDKWRMPGVHIGNSVINSYFDLNGRLDDYCTIDSVVRISPPFVDSSYNTSQYWYDTYGMGSRF